MSKSKKYINETNPCGCNDTNSSFLVCDNLELISTDNTVKINKTTPNGRCTYNLRVNSTGTLLVKDDSQTISWEGDGKNTPLKANVIISEEANNGLVYNNGLYVDLSLIDETANTKEDSPTIAITLTGTKFRQIRADMKISAEVGNGFQILEDGVYVSASGGTIDNFRPGDAGKPAVGALTYTPSGNAFLNKRLFVWRSGIVLPPTNLGDGNGFYTKPLNSNTLTFSHALLADDYIIIIAL